MACMGLVNTYGQLVAMRVLLGVAEAGTCTLDATINSLPDKL